MGTDILNLQQELEQAKNGLKDVDEHIKKLIGRDPSELPPRPLKRSIPDEKGRPGIKPLNRIRGFTRENEEPSNKRRNSGSVFSRLSDRITDDVPQKGLISKVIVTNKEIPSREEALQAQNKDVKFKERNRRMFGALLGTLQKFQQEETKLKQREEKRAQLEKKIEEHEIKEKEEIKKEKQELFFNRKKKQAEIKVIELKMLRMKEYSAWEQSQKPRKNFLVTKAKPHIHYLPRKLTDKTRELLGESKVEVEKLIEKKKQQITDELKHIEERIKRNFEQKFSQKDEKDETATESLEHEQENDEQFEEVLVESQIAIKNEKDHHIDNDEKEDEPKERECESVVAVETETEVTVNSQTDQQILTDNFKEVQNSGEETLIVTQIVTVRNEDVNQVENTVENDNKSNHDVQMTE